MLFCSSSPTRESDGDCDGFTLLSLGVRSGYADFLPPCFADEEAQGFFEEEEAAPSSPTGRRSGLSMAAMEQQDSSFFGFEDPGGAFNDDDDDAPWQDDEELEVGSAAAGADADAWLEELPLDDSSASEWGLKGSRRRAGAASSARRR